MPMAIDWKDLADQIVSRSDGSEDNLILYISEGLRHAHMDARAEAFEEAMESIRKSADGGVLNWNAAQDVIAPIRARAQDRPVKPFP